MRTSLSIDGKKLWCNINRKALNVESNWMSLHKVEEGDTCTIKKEIIRGYSCPE